VGKSGFPSTQSCIVNFSLPSGLNLDSDSDVKKLAEEYVRKVILFGSRARADAEKGSDIDILVILDREFDIRVKETVYEIAYELSLEYDVVLDVIVYSRAEWEKYGGVFPFLSMLKKGLKEGRNNAYT